MFARSKLTEPRLPISFLTCTRSSMPAIPLPAHWSPSSELLVSVDRSSAEWRQVAAHFDASKHPKHSIVSVLRVQVRSSALATQQGGCRLLAQYCTLPRQLTALLP